MTTTSRQAFTRLRAQRIGDPTHRSTARGRNRPDTVEWELDLRGARPSQQGRHRVAIAAVTAGCAGLAITGALLTDHRSSPLASTAGSATSAGVEEGPWQSCTQQLGPQPLSRLGRSPGTPLPTGFRATLVVACGQRTERRTTSPAEVAALEAALREPAEPRSTGGCLSSGYYLPDVVVVVDDQGRWLRPTLPAASCGGPIASVRAALGPIVEPIGR